MNIVTITVEGGERLQFADHEQVWLLQSDPCIHIGKEAVGNICAGCWIVLGVDLRTRIPREAEFRVVKVENVSMLARPQYRGALVEL